MIENDHFNSGDVVVHRGVYKSKVWIARAVRVVEDNLASTKLLLVPGALCKFSAGLLARRYGLESKNVSQSRWDEQETVDWKLVDRIWQERRFLILLQPGKYYSIQLCWQHNTGEFLGWYVNFELPFTRTSIGFDTLDLELDLIISQTCLFIGKTPMNTTRVLDAVSLHLTKLRELKRLKKKSLTLSRKKLRPSTEVC